jgi:pyrroloquinoline quinone biosynthesis protein B
LALEALLPYILVLGIVQDGGLPHIGCQRTECVRARKDATMRRSVSSLAIVDPVTNEHWILDVTPDFPDQIASVPGKLAGVFLTHAHIGHYTGLMYLGREALGAREVPVYAMPRMREFLTNNGPWSQLVTLRNIALRPLEDGVRLNERITVTAFRVPHRDEYSETVGLIVTGPSRKILYLPDIDKWERWDRNIEDVLATVDTAYIDGTFYADGEVPGRSMSEIPHPFIVETMRRVPKYASKVRFIHLNHTNPVLWQPRLVEKEGFRIAKEGEKSPL